MPGDSVAYATLSPGLIIAVSFLFWDRTRYDPVFSIGSAHPDGLVGIFHGDIIGGLLMVHIYIQFRYPIPFIIFPDMRPQHGRQLIGKDIVNDKKGLAGLGTIVIICP